MNHHLLRDELRPPPAPPPGAAYSAGAARAPGRGAGPELARRAQMERTRGRLVVAACGFAALFGAVGVKLGLATVLDPAMPKLRAAPRVPTAETTSAPRAAITDRNGVVLALSIPVTEFYANPQEINDPEAAAEKLVAVLPDLDHERLVERLTQRNVPGTDRPVQFAYIARNLTPRQRQAVNDLGVLGFHFRDAERRFHPQGSAAAHLLGSVDVDGRGTAGVERSFDERLRTGREPLRLSVDVRVQMALREAVAKAIADFTGVGGAGVVVDVHTAEVLAMVSLPDFDISDPASLIRKPPKPGQQARPDQDPAFNRATVGLYEPGSTFKLFTAAMALDSGAVNIWNGFDASKPIRYGRFQIDDFKGKNRWLAVPEIVAFSSNIGTAHMAVAVGTQRHRDYMGRFGMLSRAGLELPEVARPLAPSAQHWRDINTMTIGFGHGISVTPLHVVNGVATLANGGVLRQPTLVAQAPGAEREGVRVISEKTSETMRRLMRLVVTDGSGKGADVPGYFVGGKTGTAQKTGPRGGYLENKRIAAFVGAFPMNAPRYAFYVMVDEPNPNAKSHGYATAGWVTAPVIGAVVQRIAPLYGLKPTPDDALEAQNPLVGMVADYDSPTAKKAQSKIKQASVPAPTPFGAAAAPTPLNVSAQPVSIPEAPLEAE